MKASRNAYPNSKIKETKTMNLKKTLSVILALSSLAVSTAAFAEEDVMLISANEEDIMLIDEDVAVADPFAVEYDKVELYGTAKIEEDGLYIATETGDVMLNADDNTVFVDGMGYKTSIEAIENGTTLKVIASNAMTMSLPPQSYAHVVMTADENGGFPIYAEVKNIITDNNGNLAFSSKDGVYDIVYAEGMTAVEPFATRNIVTAADIKEGSRILVFADVMTMSIPAMVPANRIVILPEIVEQVEVPYTVLVNGEAINAGDAVEVLEKDGMWLVPVRAIAEKMGLEVKWNAELNAISVGTTPMGATFNIGENSYTKARMMPQTLSSAPVVEAERTYVPVDFFTEILEAQISIEDGVLNIVR